MEVTEQETLVLQLLDSLWFEHEIFKPNRIKNTQKTTPSTPQQSEKFKLSCPSSLIVRSFSAEHLSSQYDLLHSDETDPSPKSVLVVPKLQPILSGKEVQEFDENLEIKVESFFKTIEENNEREARTRRRKKGNSKSLSELEFEEIKGFMDLGFVFDNDEVKNSSLVSILPGLQRLSADNDGKVVILENEDAVSRPYLSEAWEVLEEKPKRKVHNPLMNWRIPNSGNEMELKDHLRIWAHNVASTVR